MSTPASRLLGLLSLLQTRREWRGDHLAERLEIDARTVRRDIARLRQLGYRIDATSGPQGGYRLAAGSELPPLLFDQEQAVALGVALRLAVTTGQEVGEASLRALASLRQVLPTALRSRLDAIEPIPLAPTTISSESVDPDVLLAVSDALRAHVLLRFDYHRDGQAPEVAPRKVEPYGLVVGAGRWYLLGWDIDRDDWRIFRLDHLTPKSHTGAPFAPRAVPGGDVRSFVAARFKGAAQEDRWPCVGSAVLPLPERRVEPFVGDGRVDPIDDSSCRVELGSWSWMGVAALLARFDCDILDVQPRELRDAFDALARRAAYASHS